VKEQTAPAPQTEHHSQQGPDSPATHPFQYQLTIGLALPLALVQEGLYKDLAAI